MRMASVPVVGYLSFLASNSPIANDFIAFLDHLLHSPTTIAQYPPNHHPKKQKPNNLKSIKMRTLAKTHLGNFSVEFALSGFLQNQKESEIKKKKKKTWVIQNGKKKLYRVVVLA
jgi:hypothetical protein